MVLDEWPSDADPTEVTVELLGFVRGEQKFDDKDALVAQIQRDVSEAKAVHSVRADRFEVS